MPHKDLDRRREYDRERHRRRVAERRAMGLCIKCGKNPPAPERNLCASCLERGRAAERARYARGKAAADLYGGETPRAVGAWRGRETGNAGASGWKPGYAHAAENENPWRAAPYAGFAGRRAGRRRRSFMKKGDPPGGAEDVERKSSTTLRRAPRAPQGT